MLLEPIYEHDFLECSYGFRPGRSAHQALEAFRNQLMNCRGGFVLEVDIRKFFDNLDHGHLREFLRRRVRDGVLLRLIDKWLSAGVLEDGSISYPTPKRHRVAWFPQSFRTFSFTMCWISGSNRM